MPAIRVLLFAKIREAAGASEAMVEVPTGANVGAIKKTLAARWPAVSSLIDASAVARDLDLVEDQQPVDDRSEYALIPPVSGG